MRKVLIAALAAMLPLAAHAASLTFAQRQAIDSSVNEWLAQTKAPSVSIAVVDDGQIAYAKAYGNARLDPDVPATTGTRYSIDSVSKEFCAAAILILQQEGKLSLNDKVSKYFPQFASADKVTIRQLLSHTAGYRDYWPQDFVPPEMTRPVTVDALLKEWATKPLDFAPGTDWQYSNTGYVIAGAIAAKVAGEPLFAFLQQHIFAPLQMTRIADSNAAHLPAPDAAGYTRYAQGPVRLATPEGAGWLYAAAELAMSPSELALWDVSLMNRSLLSPKSYDALYTSVKLKSGKDTHYSLGLEVHDEHGRLELYHDGEGSGFLASNAMWPQDKVAVIAVTNNDYASPEGVVARVASVVLNPNAAEERARTVLAGFQKGTVDRSQFTDNGNAYLSAAVLADQKAGLAPFGALRVLDLSKESTRGGMTTRIWKLTMANGKLMVIERGYPKGKLEQFLIDKGD
ncbi:MAG TPA: serine hydrolase domain-containing protein [Rhizomicrobium sp.]